jgi:adenine-specific DNA methylase
VTTSRPKRLIEELVPLPEIGQESSKSVAVGDIHAIHTWFARRPLAACRAATFAALVDAPKTEAEQEELQRLIKRGLLNSAPQADPEAIQEMRRLIQQTFEGRTPRVLDPFAGGGSLPLEAARLGCEAHAMDLNPVALLTMLGTVDYPMRFAQTRFPLPEADDFAVQTPARTGNLVEAVAAWGEWVLEQVRRAWSRSIHRSPGGAPPWPTFGPRPCAAPTPLAAARSRCWPTAG